VHSTGHLSVGAWKNSGRLWGRVLGLSKGPVTPPPHPTPAGSGPAASWEPASSLFFQTQDTPSLRSRGPHKGSIEGKGGWPALILTVPPFPLKVGGGSFRKARVSGFGLGWLRVVRAIPKGGPPPPPGGGHSLDTRRTPDPGWVGPGGPGGGGLRPPEVAVLCILGGGVHFQQPARQDRLRPRRFSTQDTPPPSGY